MPSFYKSFNYESFIISFFDSIQSHTGIESMLPMYGADTSGLVVEGDVVVIGILPEAQILLKIIFPLLVT